MDRAYLTSILEDAGATDEAIAETVAACLKSPDLKVRAQALDIAAHWKGFYDVDKNAGDETIEPLPVQGLSESAMLGLVGKDQTEDKCKNCGYRKYAFNKVPKPVPEKLLDNSLKTGRDGVSSPRTGGEGTPPSPSIPEFEDAPSEEVVPELVETLPQGLIDVENLEEEGHPSGGGEVATGDDNPLPQAD